MMAKKLLGDAVKEERLRRNLSQNALYHKKHGLSHYSVKLFLLLYYILNIRI